MRTSRELPAQGSRESLTFLPSPRAGIINLATAGAESDVVGAKHAGRETRTKGFEEACNVSVARSSELVVTLHSLKQKCWAATSEVTTAQSGGMLCSGGRRQNDGQTGYI